MQSITEQDVRTMVAQFVANDILFATSVSLDPTQSLSELGVLDSTTVLELIDFLESQFDVVVPLDTITASTFDTLNNITETVLTHLGCRPTAHIAKSEAPDSR